VGVMKRKWCGWILVAVIVLMTGLTACGQKGTSGKLTAASGGAGEGNDLQSEKDGEENEDINWYANKDNAYEKDSVRSDSRKKERHTYINKRLWQDYL